MTPTADGDPSAGPAEVGKVAPTLKIDTLNGKGAITLESLSGKIAVVDFWATWCGPCKQSFPKLEELAKQNTGKVQVVGISVDDKADGVAEFAKANGVTFPIGWDDGHSIAGRWKVDTMPTTYILDTTGKVRFIHAGYQDGEADAIAKELLALSLEPSGGSAKTDTATGDKDKPAGDKDKPAGDKDKPAGDKDKPAGDSATASPNASSDPPAVPPKKAGAKKPGAKKPGAKPPPKKKPATATP